MGVPQQEAPTPFKCATLLLSFWAPGQADNLAQPSLLALNFPRSPLQAGVHGLHEAESRQK